MKQETLLVEKYRPKKVEDCILPTEMKKTFQEIVDSGEIPNMLLCGTAGCGKTTVAEAICRELDLDFIKVNCSEDSGIDTLRKNIRNFASSVSLAGGTKVVILDEADYLQVNSTQPALRGFIEEFSANCRFILTCNFKNRIIEPLHSRCSVIEFNTSKKVLAKLAGQFLKRLKFILKEESVEANDQILVELIKRYAPDWRRVINEVQRYSKSGELTTESLVSDSSGAMNQLIDILREKEFKKLRGWVATNADLDSSVIFRKVYDSLFTEVKPDSIPTAILILSEYQYKGAFSADREINIMACLTELMRELKWN